MQAQFLQAKCAQELDGKQDDLGIDGRVFLPQCLYSELVKFTVASRLWPIVTKHRADVEELHEGIGGIKLVLQIGTNDRCCIFWAQCETAPAAIGERIHFLFHDIGRFSDAAQKKFRMLEDRCTNLMIAIACTNIADHIFYIRPLCDRLGQNILCAARSVDQHVSSSSSFP